MGKKVIIYYFDGYGNLYNTETRYINSNFTKEEAYTELFENPKYSDLTMVVFDGQDDKKPFIESKVKYVAQIKKRGLFK